SAFIIRGSFFLFNVFVFLCVSCYNIFQCETNVRRTIGMRRQKQPMDCAARDTLQKGEETIMENHPKLNPLWALEGSSQKTRLDFARSGEIFSYPKGHLCLRAGETNSQIFFILSGKV